MCPFVWSVISVENTFVIVLLFRFRTGVSSAMRRPCVRRVETGDWPPQQ